MALPSTYITQPKLQVKGNLKYVSDLRKHWGNVYEIHMQTSQF